MLGEQQGDSGKPATLSAGTGTIRDFLAVTVFIISALSIIVLGLVLMTTDGADGREKAFDALIPLFGTWVGTVLAFYFSRENFESAQKSLESVVQRLSPEQRLQQTPVTEAMTPLARIRGVPLSSGADDTSVKLNEVLEVVKSGFTRVPVFNSDKSGRYVIHQSILFKFIAFGELADKDFDLTTKTLDDMVKDSGIGELMKSIAWVESAATLAEAKAEMEKVEQCQDVFVTETGKKDEPVLGWVTNVDIQKHSKA